MKSVYTQSSKIKQKIEYLCIFTKKPSPAICKSEEWLVGEIKPQFNSKSTDTQIFQCIVLRTLGSIMLPVN